LVSAVRDGYSIPESFRKRKDGEGRKPSDKVKRDVERRSKGVVVVSKPSEDVEIEVVRSQLATLSEGQASEFEAAAIMNVNCLTVATYKRKLGSNAALAEALNWRMMAAHYRRTKKQ